MSYEIPPKNPAPFGRGVLQWLPFYTFTNALEHYIDVDCFLVPIQDPDFWMAIHRARRGSADIDLAYWISSAEQRESFFRKNFGKIAQGGGTVIARLGCFSELMVPVVEKGRVQAIVTVGPFADHVMTDRELKQLWLAANGSHDAAFRYDYNYFCRTLLEIPLLQGQVLGHFKEFVELFAKALAGESNLEALKKRMREIFLGTFTRSFYHQNWADRIIRQDRFYQHVWKDGSVTPWEQAEMGISFIPDRILAFMPSVARARSAADLKRLALRFQATALKFAARRSDVAAGRLGDYGALLIHAAGPAKAGDADAVRDLAREFKRFAEKAVGCDVFCGVGPRKEKNQLYDSYSGAVSAVHKAAEAGKPLVAYSEQAMPKPQFWDVAASASTVSGALLSGRREAALSELKEFVSLAQRLSGGRVEALRVQFIFLLHDFLREAERQLRLEAAGARSLGVHWSQILEAPSHPSDLEKVFGTCVTEAIAMLDRPDAVARDLRFLKAQKWVEANCHLDPNLGDVAKAHGFSAIGFRRELKRVKGMSYSQWLNQLRLGKVMELLSNTQLSASAIAAAAGFPSASYFFQWFKRQTKATPQAWRRMHGAAER
jgi:AraC-like DNA-binding protein